MGAGANRGNKQDDQESYHLKILKAITAFEDLGRGQVLVMLARL